MALRDLIPFGSNRRDVPVRREEEHPFVALQRDINRLFDDFFRGFGLTRWPWGEEERWPAFSPRVDVVEKDDRYIVTAELPGVDEKDIEVTLQDGVLTIRGEKKEEREEKEKDRYYFERVFGSFHRTIPLPAEIDESKVSAELKKGVLRITLPKSERALKETKKIPVQVS
ncbi:MAG: Hsp20/alpha crystallin family protein [Acidobacteriota bacterium]